MTHLKIPLSVRRATQTPDPVAAIGFEYDPERWLGKKVEF
jgi:hypothetical protein